MSGVFGHMMYATLAARAAAERKLPISLPIHQNFASYLAGSYLGSDVQIMPSAVIEATGEEVGPDMIPPAVANTEAATVPWSLSFQGEQYTPETLYGMFYGRAHLLFGWATADRALKVEWEELPVYLAAVAGDAMNLFGPGHRPLAYVLGWMVHVVGDSLIKSVQPGVDLSLINGKYTPENRPVQDLVTFHEVGRRELNLPWDAMLADAVETPVEPVQMHYMRVGQPVGQLAWRFPAGWQPNREPLLRCVLAENRRYQRIRNSRLLEQIALVDGPHGPQCDAQLSEKAGGMTYLEMVKAAEKANFRHALWQIAEITNDVWEQVIERQPLLHRLPSDAGPTWAELTRRWQRP